MAVKSVKERVIDALYPLVEDLDDAERTQFERAVSGAVESLSRSASTLGARLHEEGAEASRAALKTQKTWYEMKLDTVRKAAAVSLTNQANEMEASHNRQLEQQLSAANEGGDTALQEAHEQLEQLGLRYSGLQMTAKQAEETLRVTQRLLHIAEDKVAALESEKAKLREQETASYQQFDTTRQELARARVDVERSEGECAILRESNFKLSDQVEELELELEEAQSERDEIMHERDEAKAEACRQEEQNGELRREVGELRQEATELREALERSRRRPMEQPVAEASPPPPSSSESQTVARLRRKSQELFEETRELSSELDQLLNMLAEAASETERASMMRDPESAKELLRRVSVRLREEAMAKLRSEREESSTQLTRLLGELRTTTAAKAAIESELDESEEARTSIENEMERLQQAHAAELAERDKALKAMSDARDAALKAAMMAADGRALLAAQAELKQLSGEEGVLRSEFTNALKELDVQVAANTTLGEHLRAIVTSSEITTKERDDLRERLKRAEDAAFNGDRDAPEALKAALEAKQLLELRLAAAEEQLAKARADLMASERALGEWKTSLESWRDEAKRVQAELLDCRSALDEAMRSVTLLSHDKASLGDQVRDLIARYRAAEATLAKTSKELSYVSFAMERSQAAFDALSVSAEHKMHALQETAQKERKILVSAALRSLQQLRTHLTSTLSGLRVQTDERERENGAAAWQQWKSKWGVPSPDDAPVVVTLHPPDHPPLSVAKHPGMKYAPSPRPSTARAPSSRRQSMVLPTSTATPLVGAVQSPRRLRAVSADAGVAAALQNQHQFKEFIGVRTSLTTPTSSKG